jgi:hypothetical protein
VGNALEYFSLAGVIKDNFPQRCAIEAASGQKNSATKVLRNGRQTRRTGFHDHSCNFVGVDYRNA